MLKSKKLLSTLLALVMCVSLGSTAFAVSLDSETDIAQKVETAISEYEKSISIEIDSERLQNESQANAQYNRLLENIHEKTDTDAYPGYYGGAYIDQEGHLIVCVTEDRAKTEVIDSIGKFTGNPDIKIKTVKFSFNELIHAQNEISNIMVQLTSEESADNDGVAKTGVSLIESHPQYEVVKSISAVYTDEEKNALMVQVMDLSNEKIDAFKKAFSSIKCVEFSEGYNNTPTVSWQPGRGIWNFNGGRFSTGYPVYFTNSSGSRERGFITAGHAYATSGANAYTANSTSSTYLLATLVRSQFSGSTDAALMRIVGSTYTMSGTTFYGGVTLASDRYTLPAQGAVVYKEGSTTGVTVGVVNSTNYTVDYGTVTLTNMLNTSALNLGGDSGGPMYVSSNGVYSIVGSMSGSVYTGSSLTQDTFLSSIISKVGNALSALNCSIW